jgi:hypothetical protein
MATPPKKSETQATPEVLKVDQRRPTLGRFRLQVDGQLKTSFSSFEETEKAGRAIKQAYPIVQVSIYDAQEHQKKILT